MNTSLADAFLLNKSITFLNHGSFGACVKPVFEQYQDFQLQLEQEPIQFIIHKGPQLLEAARIALANFVGCHADDLVYVPNPTYAINTIAKSVQLKAGDEILTTSLEYGACDRAWEYYCAQKGVSYVKQPIHFPLESKEHFIEQFFKGLTPKTKMVYISHITSSTGLLLPVAEICAMAKAKGLLVCIDGAHAPAQVPINLHQLQVDYYTGACHKWMLTPKGSSFLYVAPYLQNTVDPLIVGWGYKPIQPSHAHFLDYHQFNGTRDFSAYLTIPTALAFMESNEWNMVAANCRQMVLDNASAICALLKARPIAPISNEFLVQLYSTSIQTKDPLLLKDLLYQKYQIEIPVMPHGNAVYLRFSVQAYNNQAQLDRLMEVLKEIIATTNLIEV